MVEDTGIDELLRQWTSERAQDAELQETNELIAILTSIVLKVKRG